MTRWLHRTTKEPGASPGSIVLVGRKKLDRTRIRLMRYDETSVEEKECASVAECLEAAKGPGVRWINVDGLHDAEVIRQLGAAFSIHPLVMEDLVNTDQRPKVEFYDQQLFLTLKLFSLGSGESGLGEIAAEQMSFVLGDTYVLSFQEQVGQAFKQVRHRIRTGGSGLIRKRGADYLLYALVDSVIDHYLVILEALGEEIETVEDELNAAATPETLRRIHRLKRKIVYLRRSSWPLRELFNALLRGESRLIRDASAVFFRDVYDHTVQILENMDGFRELVTSMTELYQSNVANRMNEVMKVLTIISTVFIPPTFLVGIYGMNFDHMPELHFRFGYYAALGVMLAAAAAMLVYFKKKRWF